jgi:hypothetical protein
MSLKKFIAQENRVAELWGKGNPAWTVFPTKTEELTAAHKKELANRLLSALSPENLCCDGELRGAKLRAKSIMLNTAKADLEALGQKVEWDMADFA